jgi:hypothetical protein
MRWRARRGLDWKASDVMTSLWRKKMLVLGYEDRI